MVKGLYNKRLSIYWRKLTLQKLKTGKSWNMPIQTFSGHKRNVCLDCIKMRTSQKYWWGKWNAKCRRQTKCGRLNKKTYHVSYLYDGVLDMEIDCWRKMYKNTGETTRRFIVKYIMHHVFSFFTLLINKKRKPILSNKSRMSGRDQIRNWKQFLRLLLSSNGQPCLRIKTKSFKVYHTNEK